MAKKNSQSKTTKSQTNKETCRSFLGKAGLRGIKGDLAGKSDLEKKRYMTYGTVSGSMYICHPHFRNYLREPG